MSIRKIVGTCMLTLVTVTGLAVSPAHAAGYYHIGYTADWYWDGYRGGSVEFWTYGDEVCVTDRDADNHGVRVYVFDADYSPDKYLYKLGIGGEGRFRCVAASYGGVYNLPEHHTIRFKICLVRSDGTLTACNNYHWRNLNS
ncbi:MAG: hypothetical protein GEU96_12990 [Propionibacteriales bacterium]|nr:hypothetical protein [Propionibacteriales bacterium]